MKIKISKILLESALIFQAKNDVRYYLNGICFMPNGRIASTDGHRAFVATGGKHEVEENVIVSIKKSSFKSYDYAIADTETKIVTFHDDNDLLLWAGVCELIDGRYPDIDRVIPKVKEETDDIGFNARYLADIEKAAKLFNPKYEAIRLELQGNSASAVVNLTAPTGEKAKVIVMPMRPYMCR